MTCFVIEQGWIIIGRVDNEGEVKDIITLSDASVVRCWDNGRGIGGIANPEYKDEYTLDPIGAVDIRANKVLFEIPCAW